MPTYKNKKPKTVSGVQIIDPGYGIDVSYQGDRALGVGIPARSGSQKDNETTCVKIFPTNDVKTDR